MDEQYQTLNSAAMDALKRPFATRYHDFIRGFVYLAERAVCNRVEQVDPAWSFIINDMIQRGEQVVITATMTILGTSRQGVGMSDIRMIGKLPNEAEKGAATDALRRCARLFGVGRYLLDAPKDVKDGNGLARWLATIGGDSPPPPPKQQPAPKRSEPKPAANQSKPRTEQGGEPGQEKEVTINSRSTVDFKPGKPRLVFKAITGETISVFTRELFKDRGYCTGNDWLELEDNVPMQFTCRIKMKENGYWDFIPGTIPAFDPDWDGMGGSSPTKDTHSGIMFDDPAESMGYSDYDGDAH